MGFTARVKQESVTTTRFTAILLAFVLACSLLLVGCSSAAPDQSGQTEGPVPIEGKVAIIHTNDVHGYDLVAEPTEHTLGVLGIAAVAQLKKDYEAEGYEVILVDDGDAIQDNVLVNLSQGESAIRFMNSAAYDVMSIGNHEFDWGADNLQSLMNEAQFPVLSANIVVEATGEPFADAQMIVELGNGAKIGFFGLTTPETQTKSNPKNVAGLRFLAGEELYQSAQEQIDSLREQGCALVVCLGHLGNDPDAAPNRSLDVVEHTEGIDLFIDGHDHKVRDEAMKDTLIVSTGSHLENIGVVLYENGGLSEKMVTYGSYDGSDPATDELVKQINDEVTAQLSESIGTTAVLLNGERDPGVRTGETNLGDFAADALLWQANQATDATVDAALVNGGSIRASIEPGTISMATMLTVFPYNNALNVVTLKGSELLEVLEAATANLPDAMGSFPQVAGITYTVDTSVAYANGEQYPDSTYFAPAAPGARVTISEVGGRAFALNDAYVIAASSFITDGGDTYFAVAEAYQTTGYGTGYSDTDALINYIKTMLGGTIGEDYAAPHGRITIN